MERLINARITNEEMELLKRKALKYFRGNASKFIRDAIQNYKPKKKKPV